MTILRWFAGRAEARILLRESLRLTQVSGGAHILGSGVPQLPSGYTGMYPLAYVPPLWFRVMDPRLLALKHVAGDLTRTNIDPARRAQIHARYGTPVTPDRIAF